MENVHVRGYQHTSTTNTILNTILSVIQNIEKLFLFVNENGTKSINFQDRIKCLYMKFV